MTRSAAPVHVEAVAVAEDEALSDAERRFIDFLIDQAFDLLAERSQ